MSETYTVGGNALYLLDFDHIAGQTFNPKETHIVAYIDLEVEASLFTAPFRVRIHKADINHEPTGPPLIYATAYPPSPLIPSTARLRVKLITPHILNAGQEYVILAFYGGLIIGTRASLQYDSTAATYIRGHRIYSEDNGLTWTHKHDQDHIFAEFGTPPLPSPEPPPPIHHFAIPSLSFYHCLSTTTITLATSVPCHLTCYYTDKKPLKHHSSRVIRGLEVPWGTYFCFVAWKPIEQTEPGDTLYHTFIIPDWPACLLLPKTNPFNDLKGRAPLWEPWGSTLTENYSWLPLADPLPPGIDLTNGILTLTFTGTTHSGIIYSLPADTVPLQNHRDQPLHLLTNNTEVLSTNPFDNIVNMVQFRKNGYFLTLYLNLKSSSVGFGSGDYGYTLDGTWGKAWLKIPTGIQDINLVDYFKRVATDIGWSTDPSGWAVMLVELAHSDPTPLLPSYLKNDYICLYHPHPIQHGGRYFTFRGNIDEQLSPSTGPIFQHCYDYPTDLVNTTFGTWPDPDKPPPGWYYDSVGPSPSHWYREEVDVKIPPYAAKLSALNPRTGTYIIQKACAHSYRGKTLKFEFWFKFIGTGNFQLSIKQTGPGSWDWTRAYGPTNWLRRSVTHYIDPGAHEIIFNFRAFTYSGPLATGIIQGVTITEV